MSTEPKKIDLVKLREKLPRNYRSIIAERTGKSETTAYEVSKGNLKSPIVLKELVKLAKENSQQNDDIASDIDNL